jgi:hypothetical protein
LQIVAVVFCCCFVQNTGNQGIRKSYCSLLFLVCWTVRRGRDYNDSSGMRTAAEDAIPVSRLKRQHWITCETCATRIPFWTASMAVLALLPQRCWFAKCSRG